MSTKKAETPLTVGDRVVFDGPEETKTGYILGAQHTPDGTMFLCAYVDHENGNVMSVASWWVDEEDIERAI